MRGSKQCPNCGHQLNTMAGECDCGHIFFRIMNGVYIRTELPNTSDKKHMKQCPSCHGYVWAVYNTCGCGAKL